MRLDEYTRYDGLGLAELVSRREVSPNELGSIALAAAAKVNPRLNAIIETFPLRLDKISRSDLLRGPFGGVPFLVKDLGLFEKGVRCESGSAIARNFTPNHDSDLTIRFRRAGLVTLGRTTTPEFGSSASTESILTGITRNPWDPARSAGGSSGGSAAAIASGVVPLAHGSDGTGSIRNPASWCGLVGLKPTRGRVPAGPDKGWPAPGLVTNFVLSRSVRDSAAMLDSVSGYEAGDAVIGAPSDRPLLESMSETSNQLKIGLVTKAWSNSFVAPYFANSVEETARVLESMGHAIQEIDIGLAWAEFLGAILIVAATELAQDVDQIARVMGRTAGPENLQATTWKTVLLGRATSAVQYLDALDLFNLVTRATARVFSEIDILLTPTSTDVAQPHGTHDADNPNFDAKAWFDRVHEFDVFLPLANVTGQPAITLPLFEGPDGLPIGVQLVGRIGDEVTLFRLAAILEETMPWRSRQPLVHAALSDG